MVVNNYYYSTPPNNFYDAGGSKPVVRDHVEKDPVSDTPVISPEDQKRQEEQAKVQQEQVAQLSADNKALQDQLDTLKNERQQQAEENYTGLGSNIDLVV